jgi:hypothetical protein
LNIALKPKILLLVPLDRNNIFQAHWANLNAPDMVFKVHSTGEQKSDIIVTNKYKINTTPTSSRLLLL